MQNSKDTFSIIETEALSAGQLQDVQALSKVCCLHDHIQLSYPAGESHPAKATAAPDGPDGPDLTCTRHWFCYRDGGFLCCALALIYYEDSLAECIAFTHPEYRQKGLFSQLLQQALSLCEDCDILFAVSGHCPDTDAVLRSLDAELESLEYQMELELADYNPVRLPACTLCHACVTSEGEIFWEFVCAEHSESPIGSCRTFAISNNSVCLHHVEIHPDYRGKGYGHALLDQLLSTLSLEGIRRVILQVSGGNEAALSLYKKTGFRITETLSYYLY